MILTKALSKLRTGYYLFYNGWYVHKLYTGWLLHNMKNKKIQNAVLITKEGQRLFMDNMDNINDINSEEPLSDEEVTELTDISENIEEDELYEEGSILDRLISSIEKLQTLQSETNKKSSELEAAIGIISGRETTDTTTDIDENNLESVIEALESVLTNSEIVNKRIDSCVNNLTRA